MKKIYNFLKNLFNRSAAIIKDYVHPSVQIVQALKSFIDSPITDLITAAIPGTVDDVIKQELRFLLPNVLKVLGLADECIHEKDPNAIIYCALAKIKQMSEAGKNMAYHNIAAYLSLALSDGKLQWSEAIHLAEMVYNENFRTK